MIILIDYIHQYKTVNVAIIRGTNVSFVTRREEDLMKVERGCPISTIYYICLIDGKVIL
ncbi:hypothetical protein [Bacillus sp. JJ722]|uniref:hypothetical protein n=1 Tax=Bacillus sp. JJ722 TaxID=3122973 RepID=UPI002FFD68F8